jgi:hypothetical protein
MFEIAQVPIEVRYACLKAYVIRCREIYNIAFFLWRKKYPSKTTKLDKVEELIVRRILYNFVGQCSKLPSKVIMTN